MIVEILLQTFVRIACFASKFKYIYKVPLACGLEMRSNQCLLVCNNDRAMKILMKSLSNCERPKFLLTSNYQKRYVSELGHVAVMLNSS